MAFSTKMIKKRGFTLINIRLQGQLGTEHLPATANTLTAEISKTKQPRNLHFEGQRNTN